jgi:cysteine desulfurase/selenocysteine lyase
VDVQALGPDFYVFSGHKTYGPTGIGVLYGRAEMLEEMPPWRGGGEMIADVNLETGTTFAEVPFKFEAGTPPIAQAIGLGVALKWIEGVGVENIAAHEEMLGAQARKLLKDIPGLRFVGEAEHRTGVVSFVVDGVHPYDIGMLLDGMGIAVRTGQHCTQPLMDAFGIPGTVRASFAAYNTLAEVDALAAGVQRAVGMLV